MKHSGEQLEILTEMLESEVIEPTLDKIFIFEDAQKHWSMQRQEEQRKNNT